MKCAVIGLGPMGQRHIQALRELNLNICGVCDRDVEKIKEAIQKYDIKNDICYKDPKNLLKESKPQLVIVATNSDSHEELVKMFSKCSKFILCEKPMANSVKSCENMIKICDKNGVKLAVNHPQRYSRRFDVIKEIANESKFGGIENITFIAGNVGLAMIGSHLLEMARIITEDNIVSVNSILEESEVKNPRGDKFNDPAGVLVGRTKQGRKVVLVLGNKSGHGLRIVLSCKYGMIDGDLIGGLFTSIYRREENRKLPPTRYGTESITESMNVPSESVVELTKLMIDNLLKWDDKIKTSASDALKNVKILSAAYASSEKGGKEIDIENFSCKKIFPWP